jgi:hypothetical protein
VEDSPPVCVDAPVVPVVMVDGVSVPVCSAGVVVVLQPTAVAGATSKPARNARRVMGFGTAGKRTQLPFQIQI